jgi:lysophospholipase L1-like esterase
MASASTASSLPSGAALGTRIVPTVAVAFARAQQVYVVGDSLTVGAAGQLRADLRNRVAAVRIDAQVSRPASAGIFLLRSAAARSSSVWVVALGTNDGPYPSVMRSYVAKVMRMAGPHRRVLWVNIVRPGGYGRVNVALKALEGSYPNYRVVDWARVVAAHRSYLSGDGVHPNARGYQARGALIANATVGLAMVPF